MQLLGNFSSSISLRILFTVSPLIRSSIDCVCILPSVCLDIEQHLTSPLGSMYNPANGSGHNDLFLKYLFWFYIELVLI